MEKLKELINKCKADIHLTINNHKSSYQSVTDYINDLIEIKSIDNEDIEPEIYEKMKELDTIIELQFYPRTPIGFNVVYHYDIEQAIDEALETLK